jgi:hypothetical protein
MTVSAVMAAMSVALLFLGSIIQTLDLSMAALASFFCIFAVIEIKGAYPWLLYAVTAILSVILMPQNMGGWFYLLFLGYYPILKAKIERLSVILAWLIKMVIFNAALIICVIAASFLFYGGNMLQAIYGMLGAEGWGIYAVAGIYVLVNVVFIIYDIALTRLITYYIMKLSHRFKFLKL